MELAEVSIEPVVEHLDVYRMPFAKAKLVVLRDEDPWVVGVAEDFAEWECRWALAQVGFHKLLGDSLLGLAAAAQYLLPVDALTEAAKRWCIHELAKQACVPVGLVRARLIALDLIGTVPCDHGNIDMRRPALSWRAVTPAAPASASACPPSALST